MSPLHSVFTQALDLRESCICPALPATDPRSTFSESVRAVLENGNGQRRGGQSEARKPRLPHGVVSLHAGLHAALAVRTAKLPSSPGADEDGDGSAALTGSAAAAPAAEPAEEEASQQVPQS